MHNFLVPLTVLCLSILVLIVMLRRFRQPYLVAYILAGVCLGNSGTKIITDLNTIQQAGDIGILFLMLFLGMKLQFPKKRDDLYKPILVQGLKIFCSGLLAGFFGWVFHFSFANSFLIAIMLVFNSTAIVSDYLIRNKEINTPFGRLIINVLLLQDILVAPLFLIFRFVINKNSSIQELIISIGIFFLIALCLKKLHKYRMFISKQIFDDHEMQLFVAVCFCFTCAVLADFGGLPPALGSFAAGIVIGKFPAFHWFEKVLKPFQVFFTALFFVWIGLTIDLNFFVDHLEVITAGVVLIILNNTFLTSAIFKFVNFSGTRSLYGGSLLAQTGEFGILAFTMARSIGAITADFFEIGVSITAFTLLFSTCWITLVQKLIFRKVTNGEEFPHLIMNDL